MQTRGKLVIGYLAGAVAIHFALVACGSMMSGGDAGAVLDAEVRDADAQTGGGARTMEAPCRRFAPDGGLAYFAAEFTVPGLVPSSATEVSSRLCGFQCPGGDCGNARPYGRPAYECIEGGALMRAGQVDVLCGLDSDHATTARIWIR